MFCFFDFAEIADFIDFLRSDSLFRIVILKSSYAARRINIHKYDFLIEIDN